MCTTFKRMSTLDRPLVVILFGGRSSEHQISCATAGGVLSAIDTHKWSPVAVGITPDGQWVPMPNDPNAYALGEGAGYTVTAGVQRMGILPGSDHLIRYEVDKGGAIVPGSTQTVGEITVVFPLLHGPYGEDGTLQGLLEMSGVPYVGCGVASSAICQDKYLTKTVVGSTGIDVGEWVSFTRAEWERDEDDITERVTSLGYPVFVKPCRAGSSMGITRVKGVDELAAAVVEAQRHDPRVIVEASNPGREIECGVLGLADGSVRASAVGEIKVLSEGFYDYQSKYFAPDTVALECPADLPEGVAERVRASALDAFAALEGEGISRVDFFYDESTDRLILNEVNTLPGFTPLSLYPVMFEAEGVSYAELVDALIEEAAARPDGLR